MFGCKVGVGLTSKRKKGVNMFGFGKKKEKKEGLVTENYDSGQKRTETNFWKGMKHGPFTGWYENGSISLKGEYNFRNKYRIWTTWNENGNKISETEFDEYGKQIGLSISWYENGNMKARCQMHEDWIHGTYETWHSNGVMSERFQAKFGEKDEDGECTTWDEDGNVTSGKIH